MSEKALEILKPLVKSFRCKNKKIIIKDIESVPNDGTEASDIVRKLMMKYTCSSERDLLSNVSIMKKLGEENIQQEIERFKTYSDKRQISSGTDTDQLYKVLKEWEKVFSTFMTFPASIHVKGFENNILENIHMRDVINANKNKKTFSIPLAIAVMGEDSGIHAVGIFVDIRLDEWSIEYFDSGGVAPPTFVIEWMEKQRKILNSEFNKKVKTFVTKNLIHQLTSSECGLHTLIYFRRRIEGIPYQMFNIFKIPDSAAINFRRRIYS
jgi:hypothetical protein